MSRLDELQKEERLLLEKEETLSLESKQVERITESYDAHFHEASRFLNRLEFQFQKNSERSYFEAITDEFSHKSRQIMERLELDRDELHVEKRTIEQKRDDLFYEKKRLATEDNKNEC